MISYVDLKNIHVLQTNQQQQQQSKLVNKETKKQQQQQQQQQTKKRKIADGRDKIAIIQPVLRRTYLVQCNVFTFGGAKRSGSDRECKYFPIGMNAREPLWR